MAEWPIAGQVRILDLKVKPQIYGRSRPGARSAGCGGNTFQLGTRRVRVRAHGAGVGVQSLHHRITPARG